MTKRLHVQDVLSVYTDADSGSIALATEVIVELLVGNGVLTLRASLGVARESSSALATLKLGHAARNPKGIGQQR
jgi:hypothetical protein